MYTHEFRAMNTGILLAAEGDWCRVQAGFEAAIHFIDVSERRFTRFAEGSELSQLNRSAGQWFRASLEFFEVVRLALEAVEVTGGLFDPSILNALHRAGYDRSMDMIRETGPAPVPASADSERPDIHALRLDEQGSRIWLPPGMGLDLGGIAKGWIAEQAARLLSQYAEASAVNAGGDLFFIGLPEGLSAWEVELEDPRQQDGTLGALRVRPGAVATSSVSRRRWLQGERQKHHLIDPRTGQPADTSWLSVTVYASTAVQAEVFAKALLIAGPQEAPLLVRRSPWLAFVAVDQNGKIWGSMGYREVFDVAN